MESYKETFVYILDRLTCPHCKEIFIDPVTLDCGHSVCLACAETIGSKNEEGQRCCCCPKCGVESVREDLWSRVNRTLREAADAARGHAASFGKGRSAPEACRAGDSGGENLMSERSFGSSCSISSMAPPPNMLLKGEVFEWMYILTDCLESEDELSQRPSGSSDCNETEQRPEDGTSARGSLSGSGGLCEPELPQQTAPVSTRAPIKDWLTPMISDGTQRSLYWRRQYKRALLDILDCLTCPHCKGIFIRPVTLDCGHSVCYKCAEKIGSKNKEGQQCCCCPQCGVESVTEDLWSMVNQTLLDVTAVVRGHAASVGKGRSTSEVSSAGDSESGMGYSISEYFVGSTLSIGTMDPLLDMLSKGEVFNGLSLPTDGLESEGELPWHRNGTWSCSETEQRHDNKTSARRAFSLYGGHLRRDLFEPEPPEQNALASSRPRCCGEVTGTGDQQPA